MLLLLAIVGSRRVRLPLRPVWLLNLPTLSPLPVKLPGRLSLPPLARRSLLPPAMPCHKAAAGKGAAVLLPCSSMLPLTQGGPALLAPALRTVADASQLLLVLHGSTQSHIVCSSTALSAAVCSPAGSESLVTRPAAAAGITAAPPAAGTGVAPALPSLLLLPTGPLPTEAARMAAENVASLMAAPPSACASGAVAPGPLPRCEEEQLGGESACSCISGTLIWLLSSRGPAAAAAAAPARLAPTGPAFFMDVARFMGLAACSEAARLRPPPATAAAADEAAAAAAAPALLSPRDSRLVRLLSPIDAGRGGPWSATAAAACLSASAAAAKGVYRLSHESLARFSPPGPPLGTGPPPSADDARPRPDRHHSRPEGAADADAADAAAVAAAAAAAAAARGEVSARLRGVLAARATAVLLLLLPLVVGMLVVVVMREGRAPPPP